MKECNCKFTKRRSDGTIERGCYRKAVKKCRHGFYTCAEHKHGCKHEEEIW